MIDCNVISPMHRRRMDPCGLSEPISAFANHLDRIASRSLETRQRISTHSATVLIASRPQLQMSPVAMIVSPTHSVRRNYREPDMPMIASRYTYVQANLFVILIPGFSTRK